MKVSNYLFHGFDLSGWTDTAYRQTDVDGGPDTFVEKFSFQEDLCINIQFNQLHK